jgi:hypothetical protein
MRIEEMHNRVALAALLAVTLALSANPHSAINAVHQSHQNSRHHASPYI